MATEFDNLRDASIGSNIGDTVTVDGVEYVKTAGEEGSGVTAKLVPKQAVAQATKTNPVTKQEVKTVVQGTAGQAVGTDSAAATAAIQPGNTANVFTQESINVIPDDTAYLNRDISQDFTEAGTLAVGAEVKVEEKNGKFYLKDAKGRNLSNATVLGSTGKKNSRSYVFNDLDSVNYYLNFRGFKTPEEKRLELQTTIDIPTEEKLPVKETPVEELPQEKIPLDETPVEDITQTFVEDTVDGGTVETTGISAEEAKGDFPTSGGDFVSVIPSTEVVDLPADEVAVVDPNVPRTVVQQVTPPTYQTPTPVATPTTPTTGTYTQPLQTAGLSAVPQQVTYKTHYAGTPGAVPQTLVTTVPGTGQQYTTGYQTVYYYNKLFPQQRIPVTEFNGKPTTYVPPNFVREGSQPVAQQQATVDQGGLGAGVDQNQVGSEMMNQPVAAARGAYINGYADGGSVGETSPDVILARRFLGFTGPSEQLTNFLAANPAAAARMGKYQQAMAGMARNRVGAQEGVAGTTLEDFQKMQQNLITQTMQPIQSPIAQIQPTAPDFIPVDAGMATPISPMAETATVGTVQQADMPTTMTPGAMTATTVTPSVQAETAATTAQTGTVSDEAQVTAAQQDTSAVSDLKAAQGTAIMMDNPVQREIQDGELISGAADAQKAAEFTEQIEAATAEPSQKATVAGQLEGLMQQFEGGNTPPWAAGSMRNAMATLAARGLGASSMAGQAVIQAAMEAALPIAQMDAQTQAQFESQNLSNRQQRAMLAAQQRAQFLGQEFDQAFQARVQNSARIGDIANMNFTAEQNIALENSRAANTMNLNNLSNRQAMVMAEAAALANMDMANLSNRQQAAVQNAQNFLQMDMANLSNLQQTALFKAQQNIQALFTDQAAENAASQFNATSENQTNQFFANLTSQVGQFNAAQTNAMDQFNVNTTNAMRQFNSEMQQQRDLFNAQNGLVVAQANAQWRQNIATLNTAAQNESNLDFAKTINALTSKNLDEIWQRERDIMSFAFTSDQSAMDRALTIIMGDKELEFARTKLASIEDAADTELAMRFFFGTSPEGLLGGLNPFK